MKKKEKIMIGILVAITIVVIMIAIIINNKDEKENKVEEKGTTAQEETFVEVLEDGTKLNNSSKLHETKQIDGIELTSIQLTEKNNVTLLLGTITNISNTTQGGYPVKVKIVDKQGNEKVTIEAFIEKLEPGESSQFSTNATLNYADAYDFIITKK